VKFSPNPNAVTLLSGSSSAVIIRSAGIGLSSVTQVVLARQLGAAQYGIFTFALALGAVLLTFAKLGFDKSLIRFVAQYSVEKRYHLLGELLRKSTAFVLMSSMVISVLAFLVVNSLHDYRLYSGNKTFLIVCILIPPLALTACREGIMKGFKLIEAALIPDNILRRIFMLSGLGILSVLKISLTALGAMVVYAVAVIGAAVIGFVWCWKRLPVNRGTFHFPGKLYNWLRVSVSFMLISGLNLVLERTDIIMAGFYLESNSLGVYASASKVSSLVYFGLPAIVVIVGPMISELYATGQLSELQRLVRYASLGAVIYATSVGVLLVFGGEHILNLFGTDFSTGYNTLVFLVISQAINAFSGPTASLLIMTEFERSAVRILVIGALCNIGLNFLFIPALGMEGAAVATTITVLLWNVLMLFCIKRNLALQSGIFSLFR